MPAARGRIAQAIADTPIREGYYAFVNIAQLYENDEIAPPMPARRPLRAADAAGQLLNREK